MGRNSVRRALRRFCRSTRGSLSIEFMIWVPLLTYLLVVMFVVSHYMATASEVQQVANEVARSSVARLDLSQTQSQLCSELQTEVLPRVVRTMSLVRQARFQAFGANDCVRDAADFVTITVRYDLTGTALNRLGRLVGFSFTTLERHSVVQL